MLHECNKPKEVLLYFWGFKLRKHTHATHEGHKTNRLNFNLTFKYLSMKSSCKNIMSV